MAKIELNVPEVISNTAIDALSGTAGICIGVYVATHDAMNDPELSIATGIGAGIATTWILEGTLRSIRNGVVKLHHRIGMKNAVKRMWERIGVDPTEHEDGDDEEEEK